MTSSRTSRRVVLPLIAVCVLVTGLFAVRAVAQGAPAVRILNPSAHSTEVSDKEQPYHFTAWAENPPSDAQVDFEIQLSTGTRIALGTATRVPGNTFELRRDIPADVPDGSHTLRARLFSGGAEVASHERAINVNRSPDANPADTPQDAAATVEMTYPTNGGAIGFHRGSAVLSVNLSADAASVTVFYTTSPVGQEPVWVECGDETTSPNEVGDGVRCTLEADAAAASVTAVAAVANRAILLVPDPDSGDAHRVAQVYEQVPTGVTVAPTSHVIDTVPACSQILVARVIDQQGRQIAGANVDVHATGPTNNLRFDKFTGTDGVDANQAPDQHHTQTGTAYNCSTNAFTGTQGVHGRASPDTDIMHVESAAAGTDDAGQFTFRLRSADQGGTQITAWADDDNNDVLCEGDPVGTATVGWGQPAPAPVAEAPTSPCPAPVTPTPTPTATGTPTPTPTPTTTPTPPPGKCGREDAIRGTEGDDTLVGTPGNDVICGFGGNDTLRGLGGDDILIGGSGDDSLEGGGGDDTAKGGSGGDVLEGGGGKDILRGGGGRDTIKGNKGHDSLRGGRGGDTLRGGAGNDTMRGGPGTDSCRDNSGRNVFRSCERR